MSSKYSAEIMAGYTVSKCINDGLPISNLQLQKILYYIQKRYLTDNKTAFDDDFEAWQFGPVIPLIYYKYSGFGAMPIDISDSNYEISLIDMDIVDPIIESKRSLNPWDMVKDTHKPGGAWDRTYQNGKGNHRIISKKMIKDAG